MNVNPLQYQINNQPAFKGLKFRRPNNLKLFDEFICKAPATKNNPFSKDYFVRIENGYTEKELAIKVDDIDFNEIGQSTLFIKKPKTIYNGNMDVISKKNKFSGAGSVMALGGIITMLENNIDKIELHSLGQAIYFHSKFKFKPKLTNISDLKDYIINDVLTKENDKRFENVCALARKWLKKEDTSPEIINEGNNILFQYLQTVNKNKLNKNDEYMIIPGFDMALTKKSVLNNSDYFNELFKKYGIDYQIKNSSY